MFSVTICLPLVAEAEGIGPYAGSCRGMEEEGPRERITCEEKGNNFYRNRRQKGKILIVSCTCIKENLWTVTVQWLYTGLDQVDEYVRSRRKAFLCKVFGAFSIEPCKCIIFRK